VFITIHPNYQNQKDAIIVLVNSFFDTDDSIVKGSRNSIKTNFLGNEKVNIKFFQKPGLFKSIIYSFFRSSKAKRSYQNANYLIDNTVQTPFPVAFIENYNALGLLTNSFYICHHIDFDFTMRELLHDPLFENRKKIVQQFTEFTFAMHEAKINFLDHSPGNTLITKLNSENYTFHLVDLNRMKFENLSLENRMDNFKKMWLSKTMIKIVAAKYAQLSNQNYENLHKILLKKTYQFKFKTAQKKFLKKKFKF
jgi:hypothetical protein